MAHEQRAGVHPPAPLIDGDRAQVRRVPEQFERGRPGDRGIHHGDEAIPQTVLDPVDEDPRLLEEGGDGGSVLRPSGPHRRRL